MPADKLGELLSAYARPYSLTESRSESSSSDKVSRSFFKAYGYARQRKRGRWSADAPLPVWLTRTRFAYINCWPIGCTLWS